MQSSRHHLSCHQTKSLSSHTASLALTKPWRRSGWQGKSSCTSCCTNPDIISQLHIRLQFLACCLIHKRSKDLSLKFRVCEAATYAVLQHIGLKCCVQSCQALCCKQSCQPVAGRHGFCDDIHETLLNDIHENFEPLALPFPL